MKKVISLLLSGMIIFSNVGYALAEQVANSKQSTYSESTVKSIESTKKETENKETDITEKTVETLKPTTGSTSKKTTENSKSETEGVSKQTETKTSQDNTTDDTDATVALEHKKLSEINNPTGIWDGSIAASFAGGKGTEKNPYLISDGSHLAKIADDVNSEKNDYSGKYFKMTNDIYLNDITNWDTWSKDNAPANSWSGIGKRIYHKPNGSLGQPYYVYFKGNFDGGNYSIKGAYSHKVKKKYRCFCGNQ